ncbi:DUF3021 domain-containing protein [Bacillus solitudinis]|uniref:DUF3021 domain-containing protein n=1 Tax=Bacillus solitudinis TaxID=2014074 RepID=UPI000C245D6E|nr:DUF3021 domain-containing protein [Bacillus solitudinis]
METFLFRSMIGIFFGAFIAVITTNIVVYFGGQHILDGEIFLKNSLGTIFCGWFFTVSPLYFEIKTLSLPKQTALHFITVTVPYFILSFSIGWIPFDMKSVLLSIAFFLVVYVIIWFSFYLYFKNEAKKLNENLRNL